MSLLRQHVSVSLKEAVVLQKARRFVDGCPWVCLQAALCACVCGCAHRPADSGTSTECLPFPQSFDVTRSCCDNEPCALPQGEHPVVCPGALPKLWPRPATHTHTHTCIYTLGTRQCKTLTFHWESVNALAAFMWHKCFGSRIDTYADADLRSVLQH